MIDPAQTDDARNDDAVADDAQADHAQSWTHDPPSVAVVVVSHNGAVWLPKVLTSLTGMVHAPDVWRAVDVASTDGSGELLASSLGSERLLRAPKGTGFGGAVQLAVDAMPRTEWLWLLHDDNAVLPTTLAALLDVATSADDIAVVGPKIREWPSLRRLLEVGLTITGTGNRETGLETGEPDAGQHDRSRDVLAVSSAGMLVRREVWDELSGFDADLPLYFDDIDFGWRVARAGHRTVTAPQGVLFHVEASTRRVRRRAAGDQPVWERRRAGMFTLLANAGPVLVWWQLVRLLFGSVLRVVGLLVAKDPEAAGDELLAVRSTYAHPLKLVRARRRRALTARRSNRTIRGLFASRWLPYQHGFDAMREATAAIVRPETVETVGRRSSLENTPAEVDDLDDGPPLLQRRPWFVTVVALGLLSLIASRTLLDGIFSGGLSGGALLRAPDTAGGWWSLMVGGERSLGLTADAESPIFSLLLAVVATPVWFAPDLVVSTLMLFAVPLAGLAAHRLGRQITSDRSARIVWAVTYGAAVAAVGAVPAGRLGTVVALVVVPIIVNVGWQVVADPTWQRALRLGIWIAVGAAFAPVVLVLSVLGLAVLWFREGARIGRHLALSLGAALLLLGPWLWARALVPWRWWWEAGRPVPGAESVLDIVAGRAGDLQAPWWLSVPLILLAVAALLPQRTRPHVMTAWALGLIALAVALLGHVMSFEAAVGRTDLAPWVGVPSVLWLAALATAVLLAMPELGGMRRPLSTVLAVAALVLPVGVGVWWLLDGVDGPLDAAAAPSVPAFLADRPGSTVVVVGSADEGVTYRTVTGGGAYLGQEAFAPSADESTPVTTALQNLVARATDDDIEVLAAAGVDAIYLPDADPELAGRIDAAPLLEQSGTDEAGSRVWTLAVDPDLTPTDVPWWRQLTSVLHVFVWLAAVVLVTPVRRRAEYGEQVDDDEQAPSDLTLQADRS
ncbi:glycosyltransferase [Aeromicrobium sp. CF3.5]|uniref:glycosyltransferase n=1 Tax=Aeromicrobium sp. CF3.5 TaxID=3373078 RepID=UPI003EE45BBA